MAYRPEEIDLKLIANERRVLKRPPNATPPPRLSDGFDVPCFTCDHVGTPTVTATNLVDRWETEYVVHCTQCNQMFGFFLMTYGQQQQQRDSSRQQFSEGCQRIVREYLEVQAQEPVQETPRENVRRIRRPVTVFTTANADQDLGLCTECHKPLYIHEYRLRVSRRYDRWKHYRCLDGLAKKDFFATLYSCGNKESTSRRARGWRTK